MSDELQTLAQRCYNLAKATDRPTRTIAEELVSGAEPDTVAEMAVEFLVDLVGREQRSVTLVAERHASLQRKTSGIPRKGTHERHVWEQTTPEGQRWAADEEAAEARKWQMLHGVIKYTLDRYADDLRVQWTNELLDSTFTLRDGTPVTWGEATIEQHEERQQMFLSNAHANMEGAARHEIALRELREANADTLNDLTGMARAV